MTIKSSPYFIYDNQYSTNHNIINVTLESGMQSETFVADREIKEIVVRGGKRYFQEVEKYPLVIPVSFMFTDKFSSDSIRKTARWLAQDFYKPLQFSSNLDRIYFALPVESSDLITNCLQQGYITLNFRCNTDHAYSPQYLSNVYDLSSNPLEGTVITFTNSGDLPIFSEIFIEKVGDGDISIINQTNGGQDFKFISLLNGEILEIDCENRIIETNISQIYRYSNFNNNYLKILPGVNRLLVKGGCKLRFRWRCKLLQG